MSADSILFWLIKSPKSLNIIFTPGVRTVPIYNHDFIFTAHVGNAKTIAGFTSQENFG